MRWTYLLLILGGLVLLSAVLRMPRSFYENELARRLLRKRSRLEKKENQTGDTDED